MADLRVTPDANAQPFFKLVTIPLSGYDPKQYYLPVALEHIAKGAQVHFIGYDGPHAVNADARIARENQGTAIEEAHALWGVKVAPIASTYEQALHPMIYVIEITRHALKVVNAILLDV